MNSFPPEFIQYLPNFFTGILTLALVVKADSADEDVKIQALEAQLLSESSRLKTLQLSSNIREVFPETV